MNSITQFEAKKIAEKIIFSQIAILGKDIAVSKAESINNLVVDSNGTVLKLNGVPKDTLQELINAYISLSGDVVKRTIGPVIEKYPDLTVISI